MKLAYDEAELHKQNKMLSKSEIELTTISSSTFQPVTDDNSFMVIARSLCFGSKMNGFSTQLVDFLSISLVFIT